VAEPYVEDIAWTRATGAEGFRWQLQQQVVGSSSAAAVMGKGSGFEDRYYGEHPFSMITVKNTFIDVGDDCDFEEAGSFVGRACRQVSEPAPRIARQLSDAPSPQRLPVHGSFFVGSVEEEEESEREMQMVGASQASDASEADEAPLALMTATAHSGANTSDASEEADEAALTLMAAPARSGANGSDCTSAASVPAPWANTFTVMMRNLPNKYTQEGLIQEINEAGFLGTFDFFYLPIDPETGANRGYVFINFVEPSYAWLFRTTYEGRRMSSSSKSRKVISVTPAALQGFDANFAHYSSARCIRGDVTARPLFLRAPAEDPSSSDAAVSPKPGRRRRRGGGRSAIDLAVRRQRQDALEGQKIEPQEEAKQAPVLEGAPASSTVPQWQEEAKAGPSEVSFCHSCGAELRSHFQFCSSCGSAVARSGMLPMAAMAQNQESVCQHPMAAIAQAQEGLCTQASADAMCYYVAPRVMQPAFAKNAVYVF